MPVTTEITLRPQILGLLEELDFQRNRIEPEIVDVREERSVFTNITHPQRVRDAG